MEPVIDKVKELAKSGQDFVDGLIQRRVNSSRRNPIEILKRLQREAFSDLMKLRERQEKVERLLSFYKTSKGSPFQEVKTHVKGEVDVLGGVLVMGDVNEEHNDALEIAGMGSGVSSRVTFETTIRQKDALVVEFVASHSGRGHNGDLSGSALTLDKVSYMANINDWFSIIAIPVGSRFRDLGNSLKSSNQVDSPADVISVKLSLIHAHKHVTIESSKTLSFLSYHICFISEGFLFLSQKHGLTDHSLAGPPLLNQQNDVAFGFAARESNVTASLVHSVSRIQRQPFCDGISHCTFGQIDYQFPGVKFSLMGLQQVHKSSGVKFNLGSLIAPIRLLKGRWTPETDGNRSAPLLMPKAHQNVSIGSIALKLESEVSESAKFGGWIEMSSSDPKHLQWGVNVFDDCEDEFGWGVNMSGVLQAQANRNPLQAESYVKLNLAKNCSLKPGIAYAVDGNTRIFGLMLRSNWSF
ncbi:hypothetical protein Tsubulata_050801 [Turnera subulata]|uniref:Uncharacterized protein n=1 Tax=Turnera subulata TaxID=218843 RepID=A0A9Q0F8X0_9ROSI|nr:hypothetical protein Tsubulata_050801 [Turnera subulata]